VPEVKEFALSALAKDHRSSIFEPLFVCLGSKIGTAESIAQLEKFLANYRSLPETWEKLANYKITFDFSDKGIGKKTVLFPVILKYCEEYEELLKARDELLGIGKAIPTIDISKW